MTPGSKDSIEGTEERIEILSLHGQFWPGSSCASVTGCFKHRVCKL